MIGIIWEKDMPIYAYKCKQCEEKFESVRSMHENDDEVTCPKCGTKKPQRILSSFFSGSYGASHGNLRFPT
jgi:putative FmdB family regulatory protein